MGIVIIDYGMGNLRSVQKKIESLKVDVETTADLTKIANAQKLVLPGVGNFANGVKKLKESGIWEVLINKVHIQKTPILGICLGMQLMAKRSEEGNAHGFGWFDAEVVKFTISNKLKYKVPHIGWNSVIIEKENPLIKNISNGKMFYFVHSFHFKCSNKEDVLSTSEYEYEFTSAIQKDNIFGVQFHPEKSHDIGKIVFKNFIDL